MTKCPLSTKVCAVLKQHACTTDIAKTAACLGRLGLYNMYGKIYTKQSIALTGRNRTGPPCSVGSPTAQAPPRPAGPPTGSVTDDDRRRRQTPSSKTILAH